MSKQAFYFKVTLAVLGLGKRRVSRRTVGDSSSTGVSIFDVLLFQH